LNNFIILRYSYLEKAVARLDGIKTGSLKPQLCHGVKASAAGDAIQVELNAVAYGVFKL
jgi:hypothetical protein